MKTRKIRKSSYWVVLFCSTAFSFVAQKDIATQSNAWVMYFGNHYLSDKWGIHTEYQWRRNQFFEHWQQSLMRIGVDYYATNKAQYTLGYGWIKSFSNGKQPIAHYNNEHRIWEQFVLKNDLGKFQFQHRYRLEQRFIENWVPTTEGAYQTDGFLFRQRIRYRFLLNAPLSRKEMADNTLFLSLYDEVFLGFGKGIGKNVMDQNRIYAALGWRFTKNVNLQLGYLNQYIIKSDGIKAERNHTLQVGFTYNLDFRKAE